MRKLKEAVLFTVAALLQQASQRLFIAAYREHMKTCPNHEQGKNEPTLKMN
jgi:hypothetical protein